MAALDHQQIYLGDQEEEAELQEFQEEGAGHLVAQEVVVVVVVHLVDQEGEEEGVGHLVGQEEGAELQVSLEGAEEHQAFREVGAGHLVPLRTSWVAA